MAAPMHEQLNTTIPPPNPLVHGFLQNLNSLGADFLWISAVYQEQLRVNKGLKDQVNNISASNELLRQTCDLAEQKVASLESLLFNNSDNDSCCTEYFEGPVALEVAEEKIKSQEEEIIHLKMESRQIQLEHEAEMAETTQRYQEALARATDLIIASSKNVGEVENGDAAAASSQSRDPSVEYT